jgi:hypothetical protein
MRTSYWWTIIVILVLVIAVLAWILFATPAPAEAPVTATSTPTTQPTTTPTNTPMHTRVVVSSPAANATVGQTFTVTGQAPGPWYFEASFPVQVYDKDHNKLAGVPAQAQSDWMTSGQVPFKATITLSAPYHGPATLVLLKDNPSGLPENDDSLEVPIVIQ